MAGDFLPPQLIYKGINQEVPFSSHIPSDLHVNFTDNHWSNEDTMVDYLEKVLFLMPRKKK